jgi:hypothetical protein
MVERSSVTSRSTSFDRGSERLLWDCATIGRSLAVDRPSARARLEADVGEELAGLLLATLREDQSSTAHERDLWRAARGDAA